MNLIVCFWLFRKLKLLFSNLGAKILDHCNDLLNLVKGCFHGVHHRLFVYFISATFYHTDSFFGTCNNQVDIRTLNLLYTWVNDKPTVDATNANSRNGIIARDVGNGNGCRGAADCQNVGITRRVERHYGCNELKLTTNVLWKLRTHRTVDKTRNQCFTLIWTTLTLEESSRNGTKRSGAILIGYR